MEEQRVHRQRIGHIYEQSFRERIGHIYEPDMRRGLSGHKGKAED